MPATLKIEGHEQAVSRMLHTMDTVADVGHKTMDEIAHKQTKELAYNLFRECEAIAPKPEFFAELPDARGWKIANLKNHIKLPMLKGKDRIRQIVEKRAKRVKYLASGWLNCLKLLKDVRLSESRKRNTGAVEVRETGFASRIVTLISSVFESEEVHEKHQIVEKAIDRTVKNMETYIQFKKGEITREAFLAMNKQYNAPLEGVTRTKQRRSWRQ